jgi:phage replication-related protein YjqB (UPF0714/DUF867 family)
MVVINRYTGTGAKAVIAFALEHYLEVFVLRVKLAAIVAVHKGRHVHVVHNQVKRSVVVQVAISRAVRKTRLIKPPIACLVAERQVPLLW